jgi:outer membrane protein assembly factor BamB
VAAAGPRRLDLDGTGTVRPAVETYHERWARVLPGVKGWQRVAWSHTWTDQKVCRLQLFAYDQGFNAPRLVWQTDPPEDNMFQPLDLVYDLEGDGVPEVCVAAHYRVMIFEGTTGRKETELRYHSSRPYGWFGLADVDGDGQMELITLGDFQSHLDVLNYDPKLPEPRRLSVRWRRDLEPNIEERKKWPQIGPRPLADVTGDGRPELVLNLFNDTGDGQWHAVVLNAATGEPVLDFARRFVQGTGDVDADGRAELFLIETDGVRVPDYGTIELAGWRPGERALLWSQTRAAWATAELPCLEPLWSTTAAQGMRHVLLAESGQDGRPIFLVASREPQAESPFATAFEARRVGPTGRVETIWRVTGLAGDLELVALAALEGTKEVGASLRLRVPSEVRLSLACRQAEVRVLESQPLGVTVSTPIAARLRPQGPMTVVVEGGAGHICALEPPAAGADTPRALWRRPGRGMGDGSRWLGPLAADLDGDGGSEIIAADRDATGCARLVAYRHDGSRLWQTDFAEITGASPVWNVGALTFWWPGCFRARGQLDLFVNTRRGLMHSDVGQLVDGRTGTILWTQNKAVLPAQFNWGYAGIPPGVADLDGDGRDELISLYPVCFWIGDGRTGRLRNGVELASRKRLPAWAAYGEPIVHPFTGQRRPEILLDSPYVLALLDTNGAPFWHGLGRADYPTATNQGNVGQTTAVKHALIDLDGDGTCEIASAGYGDGVRALDPREGRILWSLATPTPTCPRVVAANIDGRPGDELLYPAGAKLIAVTGNRTAGRILWEWSGPAALSMPAIADVDGDGLAEILVQAADGSVHCLDAAAR